MILAVAALIFHSQVYWKDLQMDDVLSIIVLVLALCVVWLQAVTITVEHLTQLSLDRLDVKYKFYKNVFFLCF